MLIGMGLTLYLALNAIKREQEQHKTTFLGLAAAALFVTIQLCAPTEVSPSLGIQGFLKSEQEHISPDTILVANPKTVHAVCYVYQRDDVYLFRGLGELAYGLSYPDAQHRYLETPDLQTLLRQRGDHRVVIVMKSGPDDPIRAELPKACYLQQWRNIWFAVYAPLTPHHPEEA